jgi:hypothetical protein
MTFPIEGEPAAGVPFRYEACAILAMRRQKERPRGLSALAAVRQPIVPRETPSLPETPSAYRQACRRGGLQVSAQIPVEEELRELPEHRGRAYESEYRHHTENSRGPAEEVKLFAARYA